MCLRTGENDKSSVFSNQAPEDEEETFVHVIWILDFFDERHNIGADERRSSSLARFPTFGRIGAQIERKAIMLFLC